jgi:Flp pilus assembly protein TadG
MGRRAVRRTRRDRGAVAVEFALLFPVLLLLIFGLIDFGRALNAQITLTQAARTGAREAALGVAPLATVQSDTINAAIGLSGVNAPGVYQCPVGTVSGGSCASEICQSGAGASSQAVVQVSYSFTFVTPLKAIAGLFGSSSFGGPITLTATGVMPCET